MTERVETAQIPAPSGEVAALQRLADAFLGLQRGQTLVTELRVAALVGERNGLRVVEVEREADGRVRNRRLLFFASAAQLRRSLEERIAWRHADDAFVAAHMATPGSFGGVTHDWVPSRDFDSMFAAERAALRLRICRTPASGSTRLRHP